LSTPGRARASATSCATLVTGTEAFTMRSLGQALGADPTAVYRHFRDKYELMIALVMLAVAADIRLVPDTMLQIVLAAMLLSMLMAPLLIHFAEPIVRRFTANDWLARAELKVRIPMLGKADSLNVATATTILLYEAVRQRGVKHGSGL
jgi:AcrR family transcriptional regulator